MDNIYWPDFCGNRSEYDAFWSYQLTINTSNPDFTLCFQRTALTWPPAILLLLFTPFHLFSIHNRKRVRGWMDFGRVNLVRTIMCSAMIITALLMVIWAGRPTATGEIYTTPADYIATSVRLASMLVVFCLLRWDHMKGVTTSGLLSLFWLLSLLLEIFQCRSNVLRKDTVGVAADMPYFAAYNTYFGFLCLQFLLTFFLDQPNQIRNAETLHLLSSDKLQETVQKSEENSNNKLKPCPHEIVCFWARLTFQWLTWDVLKGYRNKITFDSLYALRLEDKCKALLRLFNMNYFYTDKVKVGSETPTGRRPHKPLWKALLYCVGKDFGIGITFRLISIPISFINPQLLSILIDFIESGDPENWKGITIAAGMLLVNFTFSVLINNFLHRAFVAGMKARSLVNAIVYRKALRLSSTARKQTTTGQVVNLMSVDAQKVQDAYVYSTLLWAVPVMIALSIYFLWQTIGPSCLAGLGVLMILVPLNAIYLANKAYKLQKDQMVQKDQRFRVMNEVLAGMKVLKLYAWEPSFENKILGYREKELWTIKIANYINAFGSMCWLLTPYLVSLAIFTTYVLIDEDNVLTANKAFVTLSLINMLSWPLSILPLGVANTTQGIVSIRRIAKFLELDELDGEGPTSDPNLHGNKIDISNGTFSWGRDEEPTLHKINFKVPNGGLVAVVGAVGSGKSSLISSILGEMFRLSGDIRFNGSFAYVPQQAWIVHNSLKENIMFGKPFSHRKYQKIIKACALEQDLAMLPGGDETEIGEKGINLSGGQKQRVSVARAVYQDEDIYLLDDPLSAVDAHVGKHIFEQVIGPAGILKHKTRVLVTHGITYLPHCDLIVVLKDGKIEDSGKYDELVAKEGAFADVIRSYLENEVGDDSDEESEAIREVLSRLSSAEGSDAGSVSMASDSEGLPRTLRQRSRRTSRQSSKGSKKSVAEDAEAIAKSMKLIQDEKEEEGNIGIGVVKSYMKACGYLMMNGVLWSHLFYMVFQILSNIWLSDWTGDQPVNGTYSRDQSLYRVSVYGYLGIGQAVAALAEAFAVGHGCYVASRMLHKQLLSRIMRAPMSFFDTTPLGRIMNRFSKDMDVLDANMPLFIRQWLFAISPVIVTIVLICYSTPIFAAVFFPLAILYVILQRLYVTSMRQWKRIDSVRRSPIYIHFDESVVGSASIRAYRKEDEFVQTCDRLIDESQRPWFLVISTYRWCSIMMELLGACVVFFSSLFAVLQRDAISSGQAGLSVSYALQVTVYMSAVIRTSSELETYVVSVERIDEYLNIDSEAPWEVKEKCPPVTWPELGSVQFSEYSTRYRAGLDLVLKNIDCFVKAGERIGIVGRTGAGKSSLSLALFRIIEAAFGGIYIDGRLVSEMGLHDLRRTVSIIPQDPVVFSGTLRSNLDPFNLYTDLEVWQALQHAHLKGFVTETEEGLDYECGENGEALSVGQRQLLCLARALLRKSKILVLDEATAAVDFETDSLIQTTIREKFKHCTILTVAHRLHTVLDYDRIMVLDQGRIIELESPEKLLADKSTVFHSMAKDAGLA